jgi:LPS-assembly lipoprotein
MRALALFALVILASCGFHLRGTATVPFQTIYIPNAKSGIALDLKRNLEAGTNAKVVDDPRGADAIFELSQEARDKVILSLTGAGRVREFRLAYRVSFRVHDGKGAEYVPNSLVTLSRDVTYNDAEILAKEAEEQLLFRDMQSDMVQQVMRRLASAERPRPKAQ